jgi:hypothetical protein
MEFVSLLRDHQPSKVQKSDLALCNSNPKQAEVLSRHELNASFYFLLL